MEQLDQRYRVIAADLYGCGKSPAWPADRPMWIDDQIALLAPVFERAGERFHLVGHSYGGAIALVAALGLKPRLASLVLYEPVLFAVLLRAEPESAAAREIVAVRDDVVSGDSGAAAERFIDYWMGDGTWVATPEARRGTLVDAIKAQKPEWHSAFNEPTPLEAFAALDVPALLMTGTGSTAAARAVARLVGGVLPRVRIEELEGLGHMAPVTHPAAVNARIEHFLANN